MTDQPPTERFADALEASADALLTVAALSLYPNHEVHDVFDVAVAAMKVVIERTLREGPKPR